MPFTPSHVLAVIPIAFVARPGLPFSALVIGSMIPDLPLYLPVASAYETTHSARGVFTACLPLGIASFLCFQALMKRPMAALLPNWVRRRTAPLEAPILVPSFGFLVRVSAAIVLGAWTHVLWDSFTHQGRWGVEVVPALNQVLLTVGDVQLPGYKLLQYASTALGIAALAVLLAAWLRRQPVSTLPEQGLSVMTKTFVIGGLVGLSFATGILSAGCTVGWPSDWPSWYPFVGRATRTTISASAAGCLVYCGVHYAVVLARRRFAREA